ncbi:hypothetical protein EV188_103201 [Actinomycetospora succinea]|uniref:Uncharacterized protein n=1 Tax=Actinomycetospora succinea TaxID=663603 RepID=A0A4R6VGW3_9PSEU|nr:hypothetical protein [Actinomycetospora succinea]TDQ60700.1 hypothetical protein EV188_103201 [Actinomycetospora succinea]
MSTDEGGQPTDEPGEEAALGDAVDDAMKKEVWRTLAPQFQHLAFESRRVRPPRDRTEIDDILDSIRQQEPDEDDRPE